MKTNFDGIKIDPVEIDTHTDWWTKASPWIALVAVLLAIFGGWIVEYFTR